MEFRVLKYFLAVAREESISGAAEFLHVTQPTLSRQLMDLEESLGKQLLIRGGRKITLTSEGMLLRKRAEEIITLMDKTESELASDDTDIGGDIYIGCGESESNRFLAKIIKDIQAQYPNTHFHLQSGNSLDLYEKLDKGLLDFGILIEPDFPDTHKYDYISLPFEDNWGVLMRKDSPMSAKENIVPDDLWNKPLICSRQTVHAKDLALWLGDDPAKLNIVNTYNLLYNATLMVEEGIGYALCLDKLANTNESSPLCFRPFYPRLSVHFDFVWKKYQVFSKASEFFFNIIMEKYSAK